MTPALRHFLLSIIASLMWISPVYSGEGDVVRYANNEYGCLVSSFRENLRKAFQGARINSGDLMELRRQLDTPEMAEAFKKSGLKPTIMDEIVTNIAKAEVAGSRSENTVEKFQDHVLTGAATSGARVLQGVNKRPYSILTLTSDTLMMDTVGTLGYIWPDALEAKKIKAAQFGKTRSAARSESVNRVGAESASAEENMIPDPPEGSPILSPDRLHEKIGGLIATIKNYRSDLRDLYIDLANQTIEKNALENVKKQIQEKKIPRNDVRDFWTPPVPRLKYENGKITVKYEALAYENYEDIGQMLKNSRRNIEKTTNDGFLFGNNPVQNRKIQQAILLQELEDVRSRILSRASRHSDSIPEPIQKIIDETTDLYDVNEIKDGKLARRSDGTFEGHPIANSTLEDLQKQIGDDRRINFKSEYSPSYWAWQFSHRKEFRAELSNMYRVVIPKAENDEEQSRIIQLMKQIKPETLKAAGAGKLSDRITRVGQANWFKIAQHAATGVTVPSLGVYTFNLLMEPKVAQEQCAHNLSPVGYRSCFRSFSESLCKGREKCDPNDPKIVAAVNELTRKHNQALREANIKAYKQAQIQKVAIKKDYSNPAFEGVLKDKSAVSDAEFKQLLLGDQKTDSYLDIKQPQGFETPGVKDKVSAILDQPYGSQKQKDLIGDLAKSTPELTQFLQGLLDGRYKPGAHPAPPVPNAEEDDGKEERKNGKVGQDGAKGDGDDDGDN